MLVRKNFHNEEYKKYELTMTYCTCIHGVLETYTNINFSLYIYMKVRMIVNSFSLPKNSDMYGGE